MVEKGILVGCDSHLEWILPWWWKHYSAYNSYPVHFVDFGLSKKAVSWCRKNGVVSSIRSVPNPAPISSELKKSWERRFGESFWIFRESWLKKPYAFLHTPFLSTLWIDLDCQINGSLEPIFDCLSFGIDFALAKDARQDLDSLLPGEVLYNSGVVAFRKESKAVQLWIDCFSKYPLPGDQDYLSRAIYLHNIPIFELPLIYNWPIIWGSSDRSLVDHFYGGQGKLKILKTLHSESF